MSEPKFVYVTYIATTPQALWQALTDGAFTRRYWFGTTVESDWAVGSRVTFRSNGWPAVLSSLKSLLETGHALAATGAERARAAREQAAASAERAAG
jgi:Activator of Hsp90 ATPase homolog 1-like protein